MLAAQQLAAILSDSHKSRSMPAGRAKQRHVHYLALWLDLFSETR
jgi:hypothetical protein